MTWWTPETWSAGTNDEPTLTQYNKYLRDNPNYLLSGRPLLNTAYVGSAITSTSTSWVAVSTTNARMSPTLNSTRVMGAFTFAFKLTFSVSGTAWARFDVAVDGTRQGDSTLGMVAAPTEGSAALYLVTVPFMISGLATTTPQIDLYWQMIVSSGSGWSMNILCASATNGHAPLKKELVEV